MSKKPYSDPRWHDGPPSDNFGEPELGLSEKKKAKRRKFLDGINMLWFKKHIDEKDIPDNLKANN